MRSGTKGTINYNKISAMRFFVLTISVLCLALGSYAQVKKKKKPLPPKKQESIAQLVEDFFSRQQVPYDSAKLVFYDSAQQAKEDSLAMLVFEEKTKRNDSIYQNYLNPKDALVDVDRKMGALLDIQGNLSIDTVISTVRLHFKTPLQRARALFYVVSKRIVYDHDAVAADTVKAIEEMEQAALETFTQKKGVCQNYANLFAYLCQALDIECEIIVGWGRNFPYGVTADENNSNHAWNAFKIGDRWILADATWAKESYAKELEHYWFDTDPNEFVYSHLPGDDKWQLRKQVMGFEEFKNAPIVHASFFKSKLKFELPEYGNLLLENGQFSIGLPSVQKQYRFAFSIAPYKGNGWRDCNETSWESLPTTTIVDKKSGIRRFQVKLPRKGIYWLQVSVIRTVPEKELDEVIYSQALIFRLRY
jgi:Transglutaminase-like superfamily